MKFAFHLNNSNNKDNRSLLMVWIKYKTLEYDMLWDRGIYSKLNV